MFDFTARAITFPYPCAQSVTEKNSDSEKLPGLLSLAVRAGDLPSGDLLVVGRATDGTMFMELLFLFYFVILALSSDSAGPAMFTVYK